MMNLNEIMIALEGIAPPRLAADWDTVGLLVGHHTRTIKNVLVCLTLTEAVAKEAVQKNIDLIVSHHPLPFQPVAKITDGAATGRILLALMENKIAVWSSHTAWDSAPSGINDLLADQAGLHSVLPIEPDSLDATVGVGRMGNAPQGLSVADLANALVDSLKQADSSVTVSGYQIAGDGTHPAGKVGIVCGSGGGMIHAIRTAGCNTFITGELKLHDALEATASGVNVIALGHHVSERFSMEVLAKRLKKRCPAVDCMVSCHDLDPFNWFAC